MTGIGSTICEAGFKGIGNKAGIEVKGIGGARAEGFIPITQRIFQFTVKPGATKVFDLPLYNGGNYDFNVLNWGDATSDHITVWNQAEAAHTYPLDQEYTVTIQGVLEGFNFDLGLKNGNNDKIREVQKWGCLQIINPGAFFDCSEFTCSATDILENLHSDMRWTWEACPKLVSIPSINSWDWSPVINAEGIFDSCILLNQSFNLNTINVTNWKWAWFGTTAQALPIVASFLSALSVEGMIEQSGYNDDIGSSSPNCWNFQNFAKNAGNFNGNFNFTLEATAAVSLTLKSAFEGTNYDKAINWVLPTHAVVIILEKMLKNTPFDKAIIFDNMQKVTNMTNMLQGCFSQSVVNWSNFIVMWAGFIPNISVLVRIDAEAKHNVGAIPSIAALVNPATYFCKINDGGLLP